MENIQNKDEELIENLTPEAKEAEEKALKETPQEELRSQIIERYGLDEETQSEFIDTLVKDKIEEQKRFSTAIKQKISWREKASKKPVETPKKDDAVPQGNYVTKEELEQRDLDSLDISDELKPEIKKYATLNKVSIKEAMKSDYISFLKEKHELKAKNEEASIGNKSVTQSKKDLSSKTPSDFDRSTPEGRKEWEEWKKWNKETNK
jgi:hypothetical protein